MFAGYVQVIFLQFLKHGLSEDDILYAWDNFVRKQYRESPEEDKILVVGYNRSGQFLQIVGRETYAGVLIYHAMTPPTTSVLIELGLSRGDKK
jgi:hypothetical protein